MASITANGSKGHHKFTLTLVENSTSLDNNTSETTYTFQIAPKTKGFDWSGWGNQISYTITINGTTYTGTIPSYNGTSTVTLKTGTQTIQHENDGTKIVNYSFSVSDTTGQSYTCGSASASGTLTLTTIPRASSIVVNDANIGSSTNITINRASANFTHTIYYKIHSASTWTTIVTKTSNQVYGWTVPTSLYNQIPNSKTIQLDFYATTYNGDTNIGNSAVVTATFTATGNPVINSCTLRSTDSTTTNLVGNTRMIRYISTVTATVSASGQNSATITSIKVNGVTATNNVATFTNATTYSYQVVVTDSRGYSTTGTYGITWTDYIPLTLNTTIKRNQPTDGKVNINFNGNYFNGSFRKSDDTYVSNTLTIQYRSREVNGTWGSWTTISHTKSGNTYTGSTQLSNYDYTKQYEFELRASDLVKTASINGVVVSKGQPTFWYDDEKLSVERKLVIHRDVDNTPYGLYDDNGNELIHSYTNTNVTYNAGGGQVYLGYKNTTAINMLNGKAGVDASGTYFTQSQQGFKTSQYIDLSTDVSNSFQTGIFGSNSSNARLKSLRPNNATGATTFGTSAYAPTIAASTYDTHFYISANYNNSTAYIGAGSADKINWRKQIAWADPINILSARPSSNITISATGDRGLSVATQVFKSGSALSLSDGGIKIGAGITKVKVSASVYFSAGTNAGDSLRIYIYKGSTLVAENYERAGTSGTYEHRVIIPTPITVAQNDIIYLHYSNSTGARGTISSSATDTYLIVEEIR